MSKFYRTEVRDGRLYTPQAGGALTFSGWGEALGWCQTNARGAVDLWIDGQGNFRNPESICATHYQFDPARPDTLDYPASQSEISRDNPACVGLHGESEDF